MKKSGPAIWFTDCGLVLEIDPNLAPSTPLPGPLYAPFRPLGTCAILYPVKEGKESASQALVLSFSFMTDCETH